MNQGKSLLNTLSIPFFFSGVCFVKIRWPLKCIQLLILLTHYTYIICKIYRTIKSYILRTQSLPLLVVLWYHIWMFCSITSNVAFVLKSKSVQSLTLSLIAFGDSTRVPRLQRQAKCICCCLLILYASSIWYSINYINSRRFSVPENVMHFIVMPTHSNFIYTGCFVYFVIFELLFINVRTRLRRVHCIALYAYHQDLDLCQQHIRGILNDLNEFERVMAFIPFTWLLSVFANVTTFFYVIDHGNFTMAFSVYISIVSTLEILVILFIIIWIGRRKGHLRKVFMTIETILMSSKWKSKQQTFERLMTINLLERVTDFTPTAFDFVKLDKQLIPSFLAAIVSFTVMFRNLTQES